MADVHTVEATPDGPGGPVWRVLTARRGTPSAGGVTRHDLELARRIGEIVGSVR
ncbi:hypothetical protein [Micromonospora sp. NPDC047074]|uniref:hypothetical protein n=1 Tax=Micromonospora sp. NPDC047074 TaxID=3154339 RepID=UPI0033C301D4